MPQKPPQEVRRLTTPNVQPDQTVSMVREFIPVEVAVETDECRMRQRSVLSVTSCSKSAGT